MTQRGKSLDQHAAGADGILCQEPKRLLYHQPPTWEQFNRERMMKVLFAVACVLLLAGHVWRLVDAAVKAWGG